MKNYKFDGKTFYAKSNKIATFDGKYIKTYQGNKKVGIIDGEYIREYQGNKKVASFDGEYIRQYQGNKKLCTIDDIKDEVDSVGSSIALVALWYFFIR